MRWIDIFVGVCLVILVVLIIYKKQTYQPLPDIIKHIKGKPIELKATHSTLLGESTYDAKCPTCESNNENKVKIVTESRDTETTFKTILILPFYPFNIVEVPDFLTSIECDMMKDGQTNTYDLSSAQQRIFELTTESLNIPSSNFEPLILSSSSSMDNHTEAQYDVSLVHNENHNRIISGYVFLNDDYMGGELEFPLIMKTITPKKGKAVFWRNIDPKEEVLLESIHKEHPVYMGKKWVGKVYVHSKPKVDS